MAGCGSNCSAGCCKDFSSRAERLPNLLSVEVTGEIFAKAVRNMTLRAAQQSFNEKTARNLAVPGRCIFQGIQSPDFKSFFLRPSSMALSPSQMASTAL